LSTQALELTFLAGLHKLDAASKTATFYIMNTSRNRNRWGVTEKALSEASPSLKGKKLGMGAGYKIDKHYPEGECMDCGVFVAYSHQGNYLEGNAKIEDPKTFGMLKDGKLGPISVVIYAYAVSCSKCRAEIEAKPDAAEQHACIKEGAGYEQVDSFAFKRVDFVDEPAYPQAGLLDLAAATQTQAVPLELLAGFYTGQKNSESSITGDTKVTENKEFVEKISALEQENKKLQTEVTDLKKAKADAEGKASKVDELSAALKAVKDELKAKADKEHADHVEQAYRGRAAAGIAGEEKAEREMLAKQTDDILRVLISDATKVASKLQAQGHQTPKTKFEGSTSQTDLAKAMKAQAEQYGFSGQINEKENEK
jgi:hypothetical protein